MTKPNEANPAISIDGEPVAGAGGGQLAPGTRVDGRFEVLEVLGVGGMSIVYKAQHLQLGREVALKILHDHLLMPDRPVYSTSALERFRREAQALSALQEHDRIVSAFASGVWEGQPYIVMEYIHGKSLAAVLRERTRLPESEAIPIFDRICQALTYAHCSGIIHRDLKPSNVLLSEPDGAVKLVDFGIAKILPESGIELQRLTQTGAIFGTTMYMSPEQCLAGKVDARSDIYSLGCLMYEVLCGIPAVSGNNGLEIMARQLSDEPSPNPFLSVRMQNVIFAMLAKDPARRPQSAGDVQRLIAGAPDELQENQSSAKDSRNLQSPVAARWATLFALICCTAVVALVLRNSPQWSVPTMVKSHLVPATPTATNASTLLLLGMHANDESEHSKGTVAIQHAVEAEQHLRQALRGSNSNKNRSACCNNELARSLCVQRRVAEARACAAAGLEQLGPISPPRVSGNAARTEKQTLHDFGIEPVVRDTKSWNTVRMQLMDRIAECALQEGDNEVAVEWLRRALAYRLMAEPRVSKAELAYEHHNIGLILRHLNRQTEAIPHLERAIEVYKSYGETETAKNVQVSLDQVRTEAKQLGLKRSR